MAEVTPHQWQERLRNMAVRKSVDQSIKLGPLREATLAGSTPPTVGSSGMFQQDGSFVGWMRCGDLPGSAKPLI